MARRSRRLGEVGPRDLRNAAREAYESACRGRDKGLDGACLQGISYYERVANRKFEGILTTRQQSNAVVKRALRLCQLNRKGEQRLVCEAGAFAVHNEVKDRVSAND